MFYKWVVGFIKAHYRTALAYTHRYAEASKLFRDVVAKGENSGKGNPFSVWYSFGCVAVAGNHPDNALQYLGEAINRGYKDAEALLADDDLKALRANPKFQELIATLRTSSAKNPSQ